MPRRSFLHFPVGEANCYRWWQHRRGAYYNSLYIRWRIWHCLIVVLNVVLQVVELLELAMTSVVDFCWFCIPIWPTGSLLKSLMLRFNQLTQLIHMVLLNLWFNEATAKKLILHSINGYYTRRHFIKCWLWKGSWWTKLRWWWNNYFVGVQQGWTRNIGVAFGTMVSRRRSIRIQCMKLLRIPSKWWNDYHSTYLHKEENSWTSRRDWNYG